MTAAQEKKEAIPAIQTRLDRILGMVAEATQKKEQWETSARELAEEAAKVSQCCTTFTLSAAMQPRGGRWQTARRHLHVNACLPLLMSVIGCHWQELLTHDSWASRC